MGVNNLNKRKLKGDFTPDFLYIPYVVMSLPQAADRFVFGAVFYFERMKDGKCTASNDQIARIAGVKSGTAVANSLTRLEKSGFIKRFYSDKNNKNRTEIKCLVKLKKVSSVDVSSTDVSSTNETCLSSVDETVSSVDETCLSSTDEQISKNEINKNNNYFSPTAKGDENNPPMVDGETKKGRGRKRNSNGNQVGSAAKKILADEVPGVNKIFEVFYEMDPMINFGHRGMRRDAGEVIKRLGLENAVKLAQFALSVQGNEFAPVIANPTQLRSKYGALAAHYKRIQGESQKSKGGVAIA